MAQTEEKAATDNKEIKLGSLMSILKRFKSN